MTFVSPVYNAIVSGGDDAAVNAAIMVETGLTDPDDIAAWRIKNYSELRRWGYPPIADYVDSQVKIAAGGALAIEGQAQLEDYNAACLENKLRFPKI